MTTVATPIPNSNPGRANLPTAESAITPRPWLAAWTLCRREWVRFIRQGNRVFAALGQPIIFWILLSGLLGSSFQLGTSAAGAGANIKAIEQSVAASEHPT